MATNTYEAINTQTLTGSATSIDFTSIPGTYTDLIVVGNMYSTTNDVGLYAQFSGDTAANYYVTALTSGVTSPTSFRYSGATSMNLAGYNYGVGSSNSIYSPIIINIQNYASTTAYKNVIARSWVQNNAGSKEVFAYAGLWKNSATAVTSIKLTFNTGSFATGSTFTLYGIKAEGASGTKATGGVIYSDATYFYHAFPASGTFTPAANISADILVVAGGGGGGRGYGGGGGAGGLLYFASQSLTSGTGYTCTVGAGAASQSGTTFAGNNGSDSQFAALTLVKGGGGGGSYTAAAKSGGSGGGGSSASHGYGTGGAATSGQGYRGGNNASGTGGTGGGGAGGTGQDISSSSSGYGGVGSSTYSSTMLAPTGIGQLVSGTYYIAGGGGGQAGAGGYGGGGQNIDGNPGTVANGTANTGGGGGGDTVNSNGGSGVIIVRYAK